MKRREFITLVGGMAVTPLAARAESLATPVIGFLHSGAPEPNAERVAGFLKGLREAGFIDGQNVRIEYRWASGQFCQLPEMAADLVSRKVNVITALADTSGALAAKAATKTIPIVFAVGGDPVGMGHVAGLNRPGGNVTGVSILRVELTRKRLGLLRDVVPNASRFCALVNPNNALGKSVLREVETGAAALGMQVEIFKATTEAELEAAMTGIAQKPGTAFLCGTDAFFYSRRAKVAALATSHRLPAIYDNRDYARAGGLFSYGTDVIRVFEQAGGYVARVLKGERLADMPIEQSAKFETVINRQTAKALGVEVCSKLLFTADEVIE
jgi:putative ABC transport system substrate-binding protein